MDNAMDHSLFESLTGSFADGTALQGLNRESTRVRSIMDHLNRIFNTRVGSLSHLPDYGLPDISDVYRRGENGIAQLQEAIAETITRYEPRLKKVRVIPRSADPREFRLVFIVSAELQQGGLVRFQTTFTSTGASSIAPWKKVDGESA
jgi:type VI secretion system protein